MYRIRQPVGHVRPRLVSIDIVCREVKKLFPALLLLLVLAQISFAVEPLPTDRSIPGMSQRSAAPSLDTTPSNPLASPSPPSDGTSQTDHVDLSSSMLQGILPDIPSLQGGYLYSFGGKGRDSRLVLNYTLPKTVNGRDVIFGQTHARFQDLMKTLGGSRFPDVQCLLGGGYRKRCSDSAMIGVTYFANMNRTNTQWLLSGIGGLEMAAITPGNGVASINFNYYGSMTSGASGIFSLFGTRPGDVRIQFAYTQPIVQQCYNLQVRASAYRLYREPILYGWNLGTELSTQDGWLTLKYDVGYDKYSQRYQIVGFNISVGFRISKLITGENPFSKQ